VRVLAVDPGTKRVGLAVSDPLGITANPIDSLPAEPGTTLAERIAAAKEMARRGDHDRAIAEATAVLELDPEHFADL